jgi:uncharacterized protein
LQEALERALADLAFGPPVDATDPSAVRAFLSERGVSAEDSDAIVSAGFERLAIYRTLVRHNLWDALELAIPRAMARLGAVFEQYFDRFLAERGTRTHYLRDVTRELLDFCQPLWLEDARVPAYMMDLARHEAVQIEVGAQLARAPDEEPGPLGLEQGVRFVEASRLMRYGWAVHLLSEDPADRTAPDETATALFVYRSPEHEVRYLETTPLAGSILELLLAGRALGDAMKTACEGANLPLDDAVITGASRLLADLAERGALLGARPPRGGG